MYYNQNDYASIPYPAKGYETATVKSGGCGVCCAAMVAEGLGVTDFPPPQAARMAIDCGARVPGGTDMKRLGQRLAEAFGLTFATTSQMSALLSCLESGGWAVANVGGDRSGYTGLFSNGGHFVTLRSLASDGRLMVWDPGYYAGKLDRPGRRGRAQVKGNDIWVTADVLEADCQSRSPRYYLFNKEAKKADTASSSGRKASGPSAWAKEAWDAATARGVLDGTAPQGPLTREQLAVVLLRLGLLDGR